MFWIAVDTDWARLVGHSGPQDAIEELMNCVWFPPTWVRSSLSSRHSMLRYLLLSVLLPQAIQKLERKSVERRRHFDLGPVATFRKDCTAAIGNRQSYVYGTLEKQRPNFLRVKEFFIPSVNEVRRRRNPATVRGLIVCSAALDLLISVFSFLL